MATDHRPIVELERNNAGRLFIGVTEFDGAGNAVRTAVLSYQDEHTADICMERSYRDIVRLMGANVRTEWPPGAVCPACGEAWDLDTIHRRAAHLNEARGYDAHLPATYDSVASEFRRRGCVALGGACPTRDAEGAAA